MIWLVYQRPIMKFHIIYILSIIMKFDPEQRHQIYLNYRPVTQYIYNYLEHQS